MLSIWPNFIKVGPSSSHARRICRAKAARLRERGHIPNRACHRPRVHRLTTTVTIRREREDMMLVVVQKCIETGLERFESTAQLTDLE